MNADLINTYRVVRDEVDDLLDCLSRHEETNSPEHYYQVRGLDRDFHGFESLTDVERAARFIYLNKTCYNGLYRVNAAGEFNVPYGRNSNPVICDEPTLRAAHDYLRHNDVELTRGDFEATLSAAAADSFVYLDPPYHAPAGQNFTGYQAGGFGETEQRRLAEVMLALAQSGAKCLLSNSDTEFVRDLYSRPPFTITTVRVTRAVNSNPAGRGAVAEVLVRTYV